MNTNFSARVETDAKLLELAGISFSIELRKHYLPVILALEAENERLRVACLSDEELLKELGVL
jgi:hypothetical protein